MELPVVTAADCVGCGACCRHMGSPPMYALFHPPPGQRIAESWQQDEDYITWSQMPAELRSELDAYYQARRARSSADPDYETPCFWYDHERHCCKHYEHRPSICREFEPGCEACHIHRSTHGISHSGSEAAALA